MSTAIEDELATARQELASLQRDYQAQAELLTEESAAASQLRSEVETQSTQVATLTAERDSALGQVTQLQARITELQASQADFDQRVQTEVARIVASTGTTTPAQVTPGTTPTASAAAGESIDQLVTEYTRLVDANQPEEAANFYHQHLAKHFNR
jgi:chromosome segregation ATPase